MRILHAGCGNDTLNGAFGGVEIRLDIDPSVNPDIVASLTDMGDIGEFDLAYCSHALEHLYPHEAKLALKEFHRVLKEGGSLLLFVPDLEGVKATEEILYHSPSGPICGLDLIYGLRWVLEENPYMAHKNGFTSEILEEALINAGFSRVVMQRISNHNLSAVAIK